MANHEPVALVTKTIGAMHGFGMRDSFDGRVAAALAGQSPVVAGKVPVGTFMVSPVPVRQLRWRGTPSLGC